MNLFEYNKSQRKERILKAARKVIGRRGFAKLTMRDLADASRVSVPTIYNLVGGKSAVMLALVEQMMVRVAIRFAGEETAGFVPQVLSLIDAGLDEMLESPRYTRELVKLFVSPDTDMLKLRRSIDTRSTDMMAMLIANAQRDGLVVEWADAQSVARSMYGHYVATILAWAHRDLDNAGLHNVARSGGLLLLLGLALDETRDEIERVIRQTERSVWRHHNERTTTKGATA